MLVGLKFHRLRLCAGFMRPRRDSPPTPVEEFAMTFNATSDRDVTDLGVNPTDHLFFDPRHGVR
jgi:hypothetical protein